MSEIVVMTTSMDGFKSGLDNNFTEVVLSVVISYDGWMKPPCSKAVCLWISVAGEATMLDSCSLHSKLWFGFIQVKWIYIWFIFIFVYWRLLWIGLKYPFSFKMWKALCYLTYMCFISPSACSPLFLPGNTVDIGVLTFEWIMMAAWGDHAFAFGTLPSFLNIGQWCRWRCLAPREHPPPPWTLEGKYCKTFAVLALLLFWWYERSGLLPNGALFFGFLLL